MKMLSIAYKDILIILRDRGTLLQIFVLPFVFILVFSGMGSMGEDEQEALPLTVVNLDQGSEAAAFIEGINTAGGVNCEIMDQSAADAQLEAGDIQRLMVIPSSFSADLNANKQVALRIITHPDADDNITETIRLIVDGAAQDMALETQIVASLTFMGEMQAAMPADQQPFTTERVLQQAESQFAISHERPLITVEQLQPGELDKIEEFQPVTGTQVAVPSFTVLFVFLSAGVTALSIYNEKKVGSFRRLMAAPMSKASLLLGKMLPQMVITISQVIVIFGIGMFLMPLIGLDGLVLGDHPLLVILIVLVMALCASGMGVLIAAVARTENQIGGMSAVVLWVMGALGGAFFPIYLLEGFLGQVGKAVPHYWASKAFYGVLVRGQDISGISTDLLVLAGFGLLFWIVGVWRFEFDR